MKTLFLFIFRTGNEDFYDNKNFGNARHRSNILHRLR